MLKEQVQSLFSKISKSTFLGNVRAILASQVVRLVVQAVYFVVLARTFGPEQYGAYISVVAVISFCIPFASWGSNWLLIQNVSRDQRSFADYCGAAVIKTLVFGAAFSLLILLMFSVYPIPNISIFTTLFLCLANLILMPLNEICKDAFIGVGLPKYTAKILLLLSITRLLASLALIILFETPTLLIWSIIYSVATLITTIASSVLVVKLIGYPRFNLSKASTELATGFAFAIGMSAETVNNDLDKTMLSRLSTVEAVGIYGAAYQILLVSTTPVYAIMLASFRNFFQKGASGIKGSLELARKLIPMLLGYSVVAVVGLVLSAPFLPRVLGEEYSGSVIALMWLSPALLIKSVQAFAADALTGANYQKSRSVAQILTACVNGILNFWLIPLYQWQGAIWATLASEMLLTTLLWSFVYICFRRTREIPA